MPINMCKSIKIVMKKHLIKEKLLTENVVLEAIAKAKEQNISFISYLIQQKLLSAKQLAEVIAQNFAMSIFDLDTFDQSRIPTHLINESLIRQHHLLPLWQDGQQLFVAMVDPTNQVALDEIKFFTGLNVQSILVEEDKLNTLIEKILAKQQSENLDNLNNQILNEEIIVEVERNDEVVAGEDEAPIVRYVHKILLDAIHKHASDIHFEPYEKDYQIRFRIDGLLYVIANLPSHYASRITTRLKIMADLDIAERRVPQDGRFKISLKQRQKIDFRVSTCPTIYGEKIVLRILDSNKNILQIDHLGFSSIQKNIFDAALNKPQGMILVTGPTGSGKTLTLYTALNILNKTSVNISTVEDPVEIHLPGVNQVNINSKAGLTFANVLRSFLRQDPDIVMLGEIRDLETAEIAIKAAQTGHLVLSTLHTNSAVESLVRLANMGVASYNIATAITLIIAQRLVRKLCDLCKKAIKIPAFQESIYQAVGCDACTNGYQGREGIFELLAVTENITQLILNNCDSLTLLKHAQHEGMQTLRESGISKVKKGITSLEEINRVING